MCMTVNWTQQAFLDVKPIKHQFEIGALWLSFAVTCCLGMTEGPAWPNKALTESNVRGKHARLLACNRAATISSLLKVVWISAVSSTAYRQIEHCPFSSFLMIPIVTTILILLWLVSLIVLQSSWPAHLQRHLSVREGEQNVAVIQDRSHGMVKQVIADFAVTFTSFP